MSTRFPVRRRSWVRAAALLSSGAAVAMLAAAAPIDSSPSGVTIRSAKYSRLQDSRPGPTISGGSPVLDMPRGYTYRVTVVGDGIDLATSIVPGSSALSISNIRRRNGLETRGPGELLFDVRVSPNATTYRRIPITFRYITGQTDRLYVEVHPGGRITSTNPVTVPADQPVIVTYLGSDLSEFVLSPGAYQYLRVVERSPTRLRIEYLFPADGPVSRYVTLGSKQTGPTEIFAFTGLRQFVVSGAQPKYPAPNRVRVPIACRPSPNNPCP